METIDKIKNGTIRIEKGRLVGLGMNDNQHIDIDALNGLLEYMGREGIVCTISDAISAIAQVLADCSFAEDNDSDSKQLKKIIVEDIQPTIRSVEVYSLNMILKAFAE
jgi:hypothetical protein